MDIINRNTVPVFSTKDTSLIREIANPRNSSLLHQSLAEARLAPGAQTEAHFHTRTEEIYYVLSGRAQMYLEEETGVLVSGDAVVIPPGARHQIRNIGDQDLVFLCCCAPAYSHDDTTLCDSLLG